MRLYCQRRAMLHFELAAADPRCVNFVSRQGLWNYYMQNMMTGFRLALPVPDFGLSYDPNFQTLDARFQYNDSPRPSGSGHSPGQTGSPLVVQPPPGAFSAEVTPTINGN